MTLAERLKLHEAICRCPTCKGQLTREKLCPPCKALDAMLDAPAVAEPPAPSPTIGKAGAA